jgi:4-amino-4-deoxy-L-arabinose transferase-like glycosyltransferase
MIIEEAAALGYPEDAMEGAGKFRLAALALALVAAAASFAASARMSVTVDEFQALPAGLAMLETGDFRYPKGTPLLSEILPAVPAWLGGTRVGEAARDPSLTSWGLAHVFAIGQGEAFPSLFQRARGVSSLVLFLTLVLVFGYARALYGPAAALFAVTVAALSPNLLAHGSLLTPDIYLAAGTLGFLWSLSELVERPRAVAVAALGLSLGACAAVKFTGLLYFPLAVLLAALARPARPLRRPLAAALLLGLVALHAAYGFHGSAARVGDFTFSSAPFRAAQALLPRWLPAFLPFHFVRALDEQLAEPAYLAYLGGTFNQEGFFSYYLVALLVKTPLATLLLALLAWSARWRPTRRERISLAFAALLFVFFSLGRHKNIGVRYLLFLFPLIAVWCARVVAHGGSLAGRLTRLQAALALAACLFVGTAVAWPDYIAYFSPVAGGGDGGHRYLLDSNLDWGQGLIELRDFLAKNGVPSVKLAYAGRVRPELYGIRYETLRDGAPVSGVVAVSANLLWGRTYFVNGTAFWPKSPDTYAAYRARKPWAILGHSIYVFRTEP